jgi:tRNA modification GTPase
MREELSTTVAMLTPPGRGAVAVVVVDGARAAPLVEQFFRPIRGGRLSDRKTQQIVYGRWGHEPGEDVVVCRRGETQVEVHCHGGVSAVRRMIDDLTAAGAIEQAWSAWISDHESTPIQAAARQALANASTLRAAAILLDQYYGALEAALHSIVELLDLANSGSRAAPLISELLARAPLGLHLTEPWRVVIAGPPNVGKSSLLNALLGFQRAIVFDLPGTTRDVVTAATALDGWPVELSDTAGLRSSADPLETAGVERARRQAAAADCLLLVFDASQPWLTEQQQLVDGWPAAIVVHNKSDWGAPDTSAPSGMPTGALTGAGIDRLMAAVLSRLITVEVSSGDAVPFTDEHVAGLQSAEKALRNRDFSSARSILLALLAR